MNTIKFSENPALKNVLGDFISSYTQRDQNIDFSVWLADKLRQEIPDLTVEAGHRLAVEIVEAVAGYDKTLQRLNAAIDAGQSKEEWLSEQLSEAYSDMPLDAAGESLQHLEDELISANMQLMGEIDRSQVADISVVEGDAAPVEWNEYSVKNQVRDIGQQVNSLALSVAAGALGRNSSAEETAATLHGIKAPPGELKAVVAGAVRVCAEKGLMDALPADTPIEVVGDFAGVAVEGAGALCDAANGEIPMTEAMDRIGRAGVAAGCRAGAGYLRGWLMTFPYGPVLVDLLGGLLDYMESPQFINNVYPIVQGAAVAAWEGIKRSKVAKGLAHLRRKLFG